MPVPAIESLLRRLYTDQTRFDHLKDVFNVYSFLRERERERREKQSLSRGGAEREGDTESEAGSRLRAVSTELDVGLELMECEIMTWAKVGCPTQ